MARSWARKMSRSCSEMRMARQPRKGFSSVGTCMCARNLSPPRSRVRITTGKRLEGGDGFAIGLVLLLLARQAVAVQEQVFRAEQAHAFRAVGLDLLGIGRLLDIGAEQRHDAHPA